MFQRRTLTQLRDGAQATIAASRIFDGQTGEVVNPLLLQFDPLTILGRVMAGLAYEQYGYLDWIALQATPFTATDLEFLLGWAGLKGITQKPATAARGIVTLTGTPGVAIPAGTQLGRLDGTLFTTTADVVMATNRTVLVPFAAAQVGAAGTVAAGAVLSLVTPIAGVQAGGVVASSSAPGSDLEAVDDFRSRMLARYADPPNGGSDADYIAWALAVPGVTRAWVVSWLMGPGTVGLFVMFDDSEAGTGGFPVGTNGVSPLDNHGNPRDTILASGDQQAVADALIPLQPVTALVYACAPSQLRIDMTIASLGDDDTAINQAAIRQALTDAYAKIGDPRGQIIYPSVWTGAIASVPGVRQFTVLTPVLPVVVPVAYLPVVGTLTFVT